MSELVAEAFSFDGPSTAKERPPSQATMLVQIGAQADLFHTPEQEAYATVEVAGHRETHAIRRKGFKRHLLSEYYRAHDSAPKSSALNDALGVIEAKALFDSPTRNVHLRVAEHNGAIYLDLCDPEWRAVEITRTGWRIVANPPIRFRRVAGMASLAEPIEGGSYEELRYYVNVASEADWKLVVAWLIAALRPRGPYAILGLHGEQGSAKTTCARCLRSLVDPNTAPVRSESREERDLMIAAANGWVVALDNLSRISPWFSDSLCRLSTGGGFATRELYTDADEILFNATRPSLVNGIGELATRGDLLERSMVVYLPTIPEESRRDEETFWRDFEEARPRILGGLLSVVSSALAAIDGVVLDRLPRMADLARWVTAAEPALGWEPGSFLEAYRDNLARGNELALEASPLAEPVRWIATAGFSGRCSELLPHLAQCAGPDLTRQTSWPKTPSALSKELRRLAPNLRAAGIDVTLARNNAGSLVTIRELAARDDLPPKKEPADQEHLW